MSAVVIWRPEALNAKLLLAARDAAQDFSRAAAARSSSKHVAASMKVFGTGTSFTVGSTSPLASLIEQGARPHEIAPKRQALRLADGSFVSGSVEHPGMEARPFLKPLLPLWPAFYRRQAAGAFRGF
jgi:hypothetical protein